ncbi:UNVERIFIED_CONTAM: hypothetical protein PYX00_005022 [Menopon gallinae]|uniref:Uncharacterized protein n=1 Tax=Menopon gallinae TaxID=328185 RepID=A0AAW2I6S4_9NEOP
MYVERAKQSTDLHLVECELDLEGTGSKPEKRATRVPTRVRDSGTNRFGIPLHTVSGNDLSNLRRSAARWRKSDGCLRRLTPPLRRKLVMEGRGNEDGRQREEESLQAVARSVPGSTIRGADPSRSKSWEKTDADSYREEIRPTNSRP